MATTHQTISVFDLPLYDVVFPKIFCYLDAWEVWRVRTVSKRFCRICWKYFRYYLTTLHVNLTTFGSWEDSSTVDSLLNKFTAAKDIVRVSTQLKRFRLLMSPSVTHLLGRREVETLLTVVADASPQLQQLCITNLESLTFNPLVAKELGRCCSRLTELVLWNVNPEGVSFDVIFLNILEQPILTLAKLSLSTIKFCKRDTLCKCVLKISNLKNFMVNDVTIDNQVYGEVFKMLPKLEVVDLRCCYSLEERTIRILVEFCSQLKELYLDKTNLVHSMSPELMKSIQSLKIHVDFSLIVNSGSSPHVLGQI